MSVAKRNKKGNDADKPAPPNEDEGKLREQNENQRYARTNQALKWAKGGIADAKLYIYAKTGQIEESEDSSDVAEAFQKLDTYKEQIDSLLRNAEKWTTSMLQTWNDQTNLIDALTECHTVINTFDDSKSNDSNAKKDKNEFAEIMQGISKELYLDQQESKKRYGHASQLLVVPLRNILQHEIMHAVDIKKKYIHHKLQFDNCCTTITNLKEKIEDIENPKSIESESKNNKNKESAVGIGTFGKLRIGLGKLMQSNPTVDELKNKLSAAREELPTHIKVFENTKQQLLEAINIVEEKLNIEVVYYVQQFYSFVQKWKSGNTPGGVVGNVDYNANDGYSADNDEEKINNDKQSENENKNDNDDSKNNVKDDVDIVVVEAIEDNLNVNGNVNAEEKNKFVDDLQIDSMINNINPDMDDVNLDEDINDNENNAQMMDNREVNIANDVDSNADINSGDTGYDNDDNDNDTTNEIEISENHDIQT